VHKPQSAFSARLAKLQTISVHSLEILHILIIPMAPKLSSEYSNINCGIRHLNEMRGMSKTQSKLVQETKLKLGYHLRHVPASPQLGLLLAIIPQSHGKLLLGKHW
jgi:hypothetical protein